MKKTATITATQTSHEQQVKTILDSVAIKNYTTYSVKGKEFNIYQQQPYTNYTGSLAEFGKNEQDQNKNKKQTLISHLTNQIYSQFYCHLPTNANLNQIPSKKDRNIFMEKLSQSNYSSTQPDRSWLVYSVDKKGNAFARKNDELRPVRPNTYIPNPQQPKLVVNQTVDFYRNRENREAQSVFYYVYSDEYFSHDCNIIRIYWNITPQGAPLLVEQITKILNGYRIPFSFKCLNHPQLYKRSDSAVLYFNKDHLKIVSDLVDYIVKVVEPFLKKQIPMFTMPLAKGVSRAEDPGNGSSFGMSRSQAIAESIVDAFEEGITILDREEFTQKYLKNKGINPKNMSINPHTKHFLLN